MVRGCEVRRSPVPVVLNHSVLAALAPRLEAGW